MSPRAGGSDRRWPLAVRLPGVLRRLPPVLRPPTNRRAVTASRAERWRSLLKRISRYRRWVSALCIGVAVAVAVNAFAPRPPAGFAVVTASRDLPAGHLLVAADVRMERFTATERPDGVLSAPATAVGRTLASGIRKGEPLTDVRLDAAGALTSPGTGLVASPIRLADTQAAELLQPGMRIDVLAATADSTVPGPAQALAPALVVAHAVTVMEVPDAATPSGGSTDPLDAGGTLVVLATTAAQARLLAQAQVSDRLSAVNLG